MKTPNKNKLYLILPFMLILPVSGLRAQTTWNNAAGNNLWGDAGNWNNGVPSGGSGTATFTTVGGDVLVSGNTSTGTGIDIMGSGMSYILKSADTNRYNLSFTGFRAAYGGTGGTLDPVFNNSTTIDTLNITASAGSSFAYNGSSNSLTINGATTRLGIAYSAGFSVGSGNSTIANNSGNTVLVQNGAELAAGLYNIGGKGEGNILTVTGTNSTLLATGLSGQANFNVNIGNATAAASNELRILDGASATVSYWNVNITGGSLIVGQNSSLALNGTVQGNVRISDRGTLYGAGTIKANSVQASTANMGGQVYVGENTSDFAQLNVESDWLNDYLTINLQVGDLTGTPVAGTDYDRLNIDGNFTFGGNLTIDLAAAVLPANYDFALINWTNSVGSNSNMTVDFTNGSALNYEYRTNGLYISLFSSLYWAADGGSLGGAGTWDTSGANWSASETTVSGGAWDGTKTAVFTNNAATVAVDEVTAEKGILFATTGYTLEDGTITLGGAGIDDNTITANSNVTATINSVLDGVNGFTKAGAGTLVLGGDNTFSGGAAISAGTLELKTDTGSALGNATSVTVGAGATLLLSKSEQVNNAAAVTLSGGTIKRTGGVDETFGDLNLTDASFLDYGTDDTGTLTFGTYTPSALLTVGNFLEGNVLVFSSNLSSSINNTNNFKFDNGVEYHWDSGASTFTITAIPEPSVYVVAAGLIGLMLWPLRRRTKRA